MSELLEKLKDILVEAEESTKPKTESVGDHPYQIGKNYFIRTVTMAYVGRLIAVYDNELLLQNASWVADSGRFNEVFTKGLENSSSSEIEPYKDDVVVGRGAIVDASLYGFDLPTKEK